MQKLFENWREFRKETLNEVSDYEIFRRAKVNPYTGEKMSYETTPVTKQEAARNREVMRQVVSLGDPTGVSTWPDVEVAWNDVNKDPTYGNSGIFVLQLAGAIPLIGKLPQWVRKGAKLLGIVDNLSDVSKAHRMTGTAQGIAQADKIDDALDTARASIQRNMSGEVSQGAVVGSRVGAKVAGHGPQINKMGKKAGIFLDNDNRAFVTVITDTGPVTFMYSSGTSYQMLNNAGQVAASPKMWTPVGDFAGGTYKKYVAKNYKLGPGQGDIPDPRFGSGNVELYNRLLSISDDWHNFLVQRYGLEWPHQIHTNPEITEFVEQAIDQGAFRRLRGVAGQIGKYPSPDSEFGKISAVLQRLSPDGKVTGELKDAFGQWVRGDALEYNSWRRGQLNRHGSQNQPLEERRVTNKKSTSKLLVSIKTSTI